MRWAWWVVPVLLFWVGCGDDDLPPPPPPADTSVTLPDAASDASDTGPISDAAADTGDFSEAPPCPSLNFDAQEDLGLLPTMSAARLAASARHPDHFYLSLGDTLHIAVLSRSRGESRIVSTLEPDIVIEDLRGLVVGRDGVYLAYPDPEDEIVATLARFAEPPDIKETIDISLEEARHRFPFEHRGFTSLFYDWPTDRVWLAASRAYFATFGSGMLATIGIVFYARGAIDPSLEITTDISLSRRGDALVTSTGLFYRGRPSEALRDEPASNGPLGAVAFAPDGSGVYNMIQVGIGAGTVSFTPCGAE